MSMTVRNPPWGRLINEALDAGLEPLDAVWAVLNVGARMQRGDIDGIPKRSFVSELTPRELEVLQTVAAGSTRAAADVLGVAEGTVLEHMKKVRAKLKVTTTKDAVAAAIELGLVESPPLPLVAA
jgi:DNA-binding CsgD family transcriptional regulator